MCAERRKSPAFDPSILDCLACPACMGALRIEESRFRCAGCGRVYPIVDGIPVLIADRAGADGPE